ncbi:MAG: hypothetical protein C4562_02820 [Actinobacteria bacterium]|nr:MAG: hypothetical protein C4562_02820 [Actinomycetota bacterium]
MSFKIAVAGKGGVGKSTLASLIIRYLIKNGQAPVLAVDADADANLADLLAIKDYETVGIVREDVLDSVNKIPAGVTKADFVSLRIEDVLTESEGFDLLVMGQGEGKGCYCYVNNILRKYIDELADSYKYVVMDNQAGLEHLSRQTTQNVDVLLIVSDPSVKGIDTAAKVNELVDKLKLNVKERYLVVGRAVVNLPESIVKKATVKQKKLLASNMALYVPQALVKRAEECGLKLAGIVPYDPQIVDFDLAEKSVMDLGDDSLAVKAVDELMKAII